MPVVVQFSLITVTHLFSRRLSAYYVLAHDATHSTICYKNVVLIQILRIFSFNKLTCDRDSFSSELNVICLHLVSTFQLQIVQSFLQIVCTCQWKILWRINCSKIFFIYLSLLLKVWSCSVLIKKLNDCRTLTFWEVKK